jgi:hypothetical protein
MIVFLGYASNYVSAIKCNWDYEIVRQKLGLEVNVTWYIPFVVCSTIGTQQNWSSGYDLMFFGRQIANLYRDEHF